MKTIDQAAELRELVRAERPRRRPGGRRTRVIAIASGKGGVGKTNLSVNLAIGLAREGLRVVVFDGDLGLANVDVVTGVAPRFTLHHVMNGRRRIDEALTPAPGGIWVVAGASGLEEMADLSDERRQLLVDAMLDLDGRVDVILVDTAAGISAEVRTLVLAAPELIVVTTPEPTAITDAYALIKVVRRASGRAETSASDPDTPIWLVVNQTNGVGEANEVARKIGTVAREFLGVKIELLGFVPVDPYVGKSVRRQVPLLVGYPSSAAALRIAELARKLAPSRSPVRGSESTIMRFLHRLLRPRAVAGASRGVS